MLDLAGKKAISVKQAAVYLGVAEKTLDTWRFKKRGPQFSKLGRRVVYRLEDLDAFLERNLVRNGDGDNAA